jgi:hypothetical protein
VPRETIDAKARRYLVEGRLVIEAVDASHVRASCRGGGYLYELGFDARNGWRCSCHARGECSHLVALQLVVIEPTGRACAA